jgi:3-hydroxyacyl-CoA dehydrogenase / 3-hydroxy-2-methylbutyryl-CoA dehydrogenase
MDTKETVVLVTGGASGIGEECIRELVRMGGRAAILDLQEEKGAKIADDLGEENAVFIKTDVTSDESVKEAVKKTIETFGKINVLINCAGIGGSSKVLSKEGPMSTAFFDAKIQVNLVGLMRMIIFASERMVENIPNTEGERGVIINTSSIAAVQGQIGQAAYAASKAGINGLMLPVAKELARYGIRVMTIAPGVIDTPMFANVPDKARQALEESIPFPKRLGWPSEYAKLAIHIIENPYLNGEIIPLTGALRMS